MAPRSANSIDPGDAFSKMIETGSGMLKVLKTPAFKFHLGPLSVFGPRMTVRVPCSANRGTLVWRPDNRYQPSRTLYSLPMSEQKRTQTPVARLPIDGLASSSESKDIRTFADSKLLHVSLQVRYLVGRFLLNKYKLVCKVCGKLAFISTDEHSLNRLALAHISNHGQDHEVKYAQ